MNPFESSDTARFHELDAEYEILGELGRGGTSVVYRARERELGRDVAIKVVRSTHVSDTEAVARLEREAKLVAALRHPNIVPLLSVRHLSDGLALVMQHVPGRTLKRAIRERGPLPVAMVEQVLREVGAALDYAHKRHGVVHRDIKPENIYLDEEVNRALLADFGIARTDTDSTLTLVGTALGTPAYMSPEQIDGTALDGRSDLYSLGLVAYEMLTGQQPWAGHNLYTIIYKQKHEELPPISDIRKDVPVYLLKAVDTLLRKDAAERCADAAQFLAQLSPAPVVPLDFSVPAAAPPSPDQAVSDDSPTVRYQRTEVMPPTPPVQAPVVQAPVVQAPTVPAIAAEANPPVVERVVEAPAAATPVLELPTVRPNWRRAPAPRGRGGLSASDPFAQPVATTTAVEVPQEVLVPATANRKTRLVAGLTLFLVLGGSGAVVATMDGKGDASPDTSLDAPARQNGEPTGSFVKASGPILENSTVPGNTTAAGNAMTAKSSTQPQSAAQQPDSRESGDSEIRVPNVVIPNLAVAATNSGLTAADYAVGDPIPEERPESIATPSFAPRTVEPSIKNMDEVRRALMDNYPVTLRERGVSATVNLWVYVDSMGRVLRTQVQQSSGHEILDRAAARVADVMKFNPAMNRGKHVGVWIQLPIQFKAE